jgi:hypothetical protein
MFTHIKNLLRTSYKKCAHVGLLVYNSSNYVLGANNIKFLMDIIAWLPCLQKVFLVIL